MMIVLDCPGCGKQYEVDASLAGKKSRCKDCGNVFRIPAPQAVPAIRAEIIAAEPAAIPAPVIVPLGVHRGTIVLNCPRCLKRYEVYASLAGKKSRCKDCKEVFTIPAPMGRPADLPAERPAPPSLGQTYWEDEPDDEPPRKASDLPQLSNFEDEPLAPLPPRATYPKRVGRSSRREEVDSEVGVTVAGWYCALAILAFIVLAIWHGVGEPDSLQLKRAFGAGFIILYVLGFLMGAWASIWLLVIAFRDKVEQGIFCLLIPFYALYYIFSRWRETRGIFAMSIAPGVTIVGFMIFGALVLGVLGPRNFVTEMGDRAQSLLPESIPSENSPRIAEAERVLRDYIRAYNNAAGVLSGIAPAGQRVQSPAEYEANRKSLNDVKRDLMAAEGRVNSLKLTQREMVVLRKSIGPEMREAIIAYRNQLLRFVDDPGSHDQIMTVVGDLNRWHSNWEDPSDAQTGSELADQPAPESREPLPSVTFPRRPPGGSQFGGPPHGFETFEAHCDRLRGQYGDRAVVVVVSGLPTNSDPAHGVTKHDVEDAIDKRLKALAPGSAQGMWMGTGDQWSTCLAPVEDVKRLADSIDFGKASSRSGRIDVIVSKEFIASAPRLPAPPAIAGRPNISRNDGPQIPADADPVTASMIQLKSSETQRKKEGIQRLRRTTPNDRLEEVVAALLTLLDHDDGFLVNDVIQTLEVWRSPQAVPKLIERANDDRFFIRKQAIKTLGKYKDPRAAEPIAAHLKEDGFEAADALKAIGPAAEPALIERLKDSDTDIRRRACEILKYVGGTDTLRAMKALPPDPEFSVRIAATEAMKQIIQRVGPLKAAPGAKKSGKS